MLRCVALLFGKPRVARPCLAVVLLAWLGLVGCANLNLQDSGFPADETFDSAAGVRQPDIETEQFGVSNKARQIESHLGVP
jgi:hypothetical protein